MKKGDLLSRLSCSVLVRFGTFFLELVRDTPSINTRLQDATRAKSSFSVRLQIAGRVHGRAAPALDRICVHRVEEFPREFQTLLLRNPELLANALIPVAQARIAADVAFDLNALC